MANEIIIKLEGFDELEKMLVGLGPKVAKRVLRGAVQSSANPIVKMARDLVPEDHGLLQKSIGVRTRTYRDGTVFTAIGPRSKFIEDRKGVKHNATKYAHTVEYGTAPHDIVINKWVKMPDGSDKYLGTVHHPGSRPHPFIRPAFDARKSEALERMKAMLAKGIDREAKRGNK